MMLSVVCNFISQAHKCHSEVQKHKNHCGWLKCKHKHFKSSHGDCWWWLHAGCWAGWPKVACRSAFVAAWTKAGQTLVLLLVDAAFAAESWMPPALAAESWMLQSQTQHSVYPQESPPHWRQATLAVKWQHFWMFHQPSVMPRYARIVYKSIHNCWQWCHAHGAHQRNAICFQNSPAIVAWWGWFKLKTWRRLLHGKTSCLLKSSHGLQVW